MRYLIMMCLTGFFLLNGTAIFAENPQPKTKHPMNVYDLVTFDRISGETVSPDGKWIVYELRKVDQEMIKGIKNLWITGTDGKGLRRLTTSDASDTNPCWSKDGKTIYFVSSRPNKTDTSQVWKVPFTGGEPTQVTNLPLDVSSLLLSPDGTKMAFSMEVFPNTTLEETVKKLDDLKNRKASGRIYTQLFFRHWDTWSDGRRNHIFIMPIDGSSSPIDIMKSMDADSPTKPYGDQKEFTFTPDSKNIIFTAANSGREEAWTTNNDLFLTSIDGSTQPQNLTGKNKARDQVPQFSPDGKTLAYLAMKRPVFEADRLYLMLRSWPDGKEHVVAENWDRSISDYTWAPDGKTIYALADNLGQVSLFAIDIKTENVRTIVKDGSIVSINVLGPQGKQIVYGMHHLKSPTELFSVDINGKKSIQITNINTDKLAEIKLGEPEQFTFKGANNDTVYAYTVKPVDFDPQKKYPVALLIHGGPQGSMANQFHFRWNPQIYAAAGYITLSIDFHASTGYGQAFSDAVTNDWGGKPFEDIQKGLAAALEKYPYMDGNNCVALGASYGAYMINWIAGNWPDRFRCLVSHDGNLDEFAAYFNTEELWFPEWEHNGTPWDNPTDYQKQNPVNFLKNWKTPMLVIHGGKDFRITETQGFSTFTALQRMGIPSKFLHFPDENHWVLKPQNSILWHNTVLEWLNQWTKNTEK